MATRLYFHSRGNGLANLPTTEQSTLTADTSANAQTINRSMNTTIGTSQHGIFGVSNATVSLQRTYFTRFTSAPLSGISSITAQTWTYNIACQESNLSANFPVAGASQVVRCMAYVWRPSSQTKVGNIIDGNSAATFSEGAANTELVYHATFSGSLVSSVSDGDVICFEVWFETTQAAATAYQIYIFYDGATVNTTGGSTVSNHASFIETPQTLTFGTEVVDTRLYFHAATNSLSNLPTTEQSSLTAGVTVDAATVNRSMTPTIGTSQTSLAATTLAQTAQQSIYFTRFVSDALSGATSVPAGFWAYNFATAQSNLAANFPASVGSNVVRITCYVWRPSSQTKLGTIFEGNSASTGGIAYEGGTINTEYAQHIEFTGTAVASVVDGDVIVFEVWIQPTQGTAASYTDTFYYDGTTVTQAAPVIGNTPVVSNHASFIECSDVFTFGAAANNYTATLPTETVSISETIARQFGANRAIATETTTGSETLARQAVTNRALTAETVAVSESVARLAAHPRTMTTETVTIGETIARVSTNSRALATETVTSSEALARLYAATRTIPTETVTIGETRSTLKSFIRTLTTETVIVGETLARAFNGVRLLPAETTTITGGTLVRVYNAMRSLSDTTVISETIARLATNIRALATETVVVTSGTLARMLGASRQIATETIAVSETIARLFTGQRLIATQTTAISDSVATLYTPAPPAGTFERQMPLENVAITESLNRVVTNSRALLNPIALSFDGVNDYLNCGNDASLWSGTLTKFSFSLWLYNDTSITTSALILDHNSNNAQSFVVYNSTVGSAITFRIVKNDLTQINCTASGLSNIINRWVHLVGTYDSTLGTQNVKFYVDSVRTGNQPNVNETLTSSGILTLSGAITDHKGYMRDFKFWNNQALSQTEVNNVFSDNPVAPSPNYWLKMDEGIGNPIDAITGTKTATLTNGTTWLTNPDGIAITESVSAQKGIARTIPTQTTAITESLVRAYGSARAMPAEVVNVVDLSLSRLYAASRAIPAETIPITETINRSYNAIRTIPQQTVSISETLQSLLTISGNAFVRVLTETTNISEILVRVFNGTRARTETVTITELLQIQPPTVIVIPPPITGIPPMIARGRVETVPPNNVRQFHMSQDIQPYPEPTESSRKSEKKGGTETKRSGLFGIIARLRNRKGRKNPDLEF